MSNRLAMVDGRILRQNQVIANKLASEWQETEGSDLNELSVGFRLQGELHAASGVGRRRNRVST